MILLPTCTTYLSYSLCNSRAVCAILVALLRLCCYDASVTSVIDIDLEIDRVERIDSTRLKIDPLDFSRFCRSTRLGWKSIHSIYSLPTVYRPIHFSLRNFSWAACFSSSCLFVCHNHVLCSWLLDNLQTCRLVRSPDPCAKNDWTDRVAIWRVDWPQPVSFCVRWVSHPKSAVRDVSWRRSLLVIKYFAALYLANGSSRPRSKQNNVAL